jgi:cytochrome c-type biogenesis protein CcsB
VSTDTLAALSRITFNVALFAYLAGMLAYFHFMAFRREGVWRVARAVAVLGLTAHVVSVVVRGMAADRVPWGNMYEFSSLISLLVVAGYLGIVELRYRVRSLGGFALGFAVLTMAAALLFFYTGPAPLVPALNSYWLKIHVVAAILGSALFSLGGVFSILYLVREPAERKRDRTAGSVPDDAEARRPAPIMGGSLDGPAGDDPPSYVAGADEPVSTGVRRRGILPASEVLDRLAYRTIAFAFPIWTFAVIAGAIWAQEAWGRYWGWDPKEVWAFITWVVFAGYLHARATAGWRGRRAAVVGVLGFGSMLVSYYVVNFLLVGLHTYAGV